MFRVCVCLLLSIYFTKNLSALILQDDGDPGRFVEFAKDPLFDSVGKIYIRGKICTGFLIDPKTVLTAGHCATLFRAFDPYGSHSYFVLNLNHEDHVFRIVGGRFLTSSLDGRDSWTANSIIADIGVLYIDYPVRVVDFLPLAQETFLRRNLKGEKAYIAGYGNNGFGDSFLQFANTQKFAGEIILEEKIPKWDRVALLFKFLLKSRFLPAEPDGLSVGPTLGDGGAPLIVLDKYDRPLVLGLVARGGEFAELSKGLGPNRLQFSEYFQDFSHFGPRKRIKVFSHYFRTSYYSYLGTFFPFIKASMSSQNISSEEESVKRWSGFSRHEIGKANGLTRSPQRYWNDVPSDYNVKIKNYVIADQNAEVDSLTLYRSSSKLSILENIKLSSLRMDLEKGVLKIDGSLETEAFTIGRGELQGKGKILMKASEHEPLIRKEGYYSGQILWNQEGSLNLAETVGNLSLLGNYIHSPKARMLLRVEENGGASSLSVSGKVKIEGGTLQVEWEAFEDKTHEESTGLELEGAPFLSLGIETVSSHMALGFMLLPTHLYFKKKESDKNEKRWTLIQAYEIAGRFETLEFDPSQIPTGYQVFLEYFTHSVQLVLRKI